MSGLLLGVDIGTSSSKGALTRSDGTIVATASRAHETSYPRPGWAEHDAENVWWRDFVAITDELLAEADDDIAAVGTSGIGACLVPADAGGAPLRPAILYGVDTRATVEIDELTRRYGDDEIMARCGSPLTTQAVGPKLAWLARHEPEVAAKTRRMFMASSYLAYQLTGSYILDHHSASQADPLYDTGEQAWISEWAADIAPGLELPSLAWPGDIVGAVTSEAAAATGLPAGTPVVAGTIDAFAEATSVGVRAPGDVMVMYGTTMFLIHITDARRRSETMWSTLGVFPGTYTLAAGMATSGAITDWLRELTGGSFAELVEEARRVPRGSEGLLMLPYFAGERTPIFDPDARGVLAGLTLRHGRGHLYRAALEGTAFGVRHNLEAMAEAEDRGKRLVAVGGGVQGGLWTQIVSDVVGRSQEVPTHTLGACYGDALLAGLGAGLVDDASAWNPVASVVEARPEAAAVYDELYHHYRALYEQTSDTAHALACLQYGEGT